MDKGVVQIYYGEGHGKSTAAMGKAIHEASTGKSVTVIEFLKEKHEEELIFLKRLEPEIMHFRFAKTQASFEDLSEAKKKEEIMNVRNGFHYAKKVIGTGECDLVILDEILGVVDENVVSVDEMRELFTAKPEEMTIICTGRVLHDEIREFADEIYNIAPEK